MATQQVQRKRKSLSVVQCFFFSAIGCIIPFLSAHMDEIGLTSTESASINALTALVSVLGPLIAGPVAQKCNKYQMIIVICLMGSTLAYTSLLFIPKVIRTPRHPHIEFDCTNQQLRMELCPDWNGQCDARARGPAKGNFTNFTLTRCRYICNGHGTTNTRLYPLHVCFESKSESNLCLLHDPEKADKGVISTDKGRIDNLIQFDARFDRWQLIDSSSDTEPGEKCIYQALAPLVLNHLAYEEVSCRPYIDSCDIRCKVNMLHRLPTLRHSASRSPVPCYDLTGDPWTTYYGYLILRSLADLFLFTAYNLFDGLSVTLTNNYDSLYGGPAKMISLVFPLIFWPTLCGFLVDYYSGIAGRPDYAPPFVLFNGLMLIAAALVIALPASPLNSYLQVKGASQSTASLRSTPTLRPQTTRRKMTTSDRFLLLLLFLLVLVSGTEWGLLQTYAPSFYFELGANKLWLGLSFSTTFLVFAPFTYFAKPLISGIGRVHLIVLCFVFYALRLSGISFLPKLKWSLLPFEAMEAFTLPIAWIGFTCYAHHLIDKNARPEIVPRSGVSPSTLSHLILQYALNCGHFAVGRALGSGLWLLWLTHWEEGDSRWDWLNDSDMELPEVDPEGFRILLRILAIISASIAFPILLSFNLWPKLKPIKCRFRAPPEPSEETDHLNGALNGSYARLSDQPNSGTPSAANSKLSDFEQRSKEQRKPVNGDLKIKMIDANEEETPLTTPRFR